jgi:hypothetical protein
MLERYHQHQHVFGLSELAKPLRVMEILSIVKVALS